MALGAAQLSGVIGRQGAPSGRLGPPGSARLDSVFLPGTSAERWPAGDESAHNKAGPEADPAHCTERRQVTTG